MNKERLLQGADWLLKNADPNRFHMLVYREGDETNHICNTVGCAVGWLTGMVAPDTLPRDIWGNNSIDFSQWSTEYFDLDDDEWDWCFDGAWTHTDNTLEGAAARMRYLAECGLPADWREQIMGENPLVYKP